MKFYTIKQPCSGVCLKNNLNLLKQYCTLAKQSEKSIYSKLLKFQTSLCLPDSQPAVKPGSARQIFHRICTIVSDLRIC